MSVEKLNLISPIATAAPRPAFSPDALTGSQWTTLMALADTFIASIENGPPRLNALTLPPPKYATLHQTIQATAPSNAPNELVGTYLAENASSIPQFRPLLERTISDYVRSDARTGIGYVLSALGTRAGALLLTGSARPFATQPVEVRQQIIHGWEDSYIGALNGVAKALGSLFKSVWIKTSPTMGPMLGFPRAPVHGRPGNGHPYDFIQFPPGDDVEEIETDVVIIGSGCGGAVCAKNLAEAGHSVIVVEKSYHWGPEYLPMSEVDAQIHLFQNGGFEFSDDQSISVIAGNAFGGGGTVNWSASLQTQQFVRQEWADAGLPFFTSAAFQSCLDRVCNRMGVSSQHILHNKTNRTLLEGAQKLGLNCKPVPQNTGGKQHYCGYCSLGCGAAEKHGPVVSFLPDAHNAGAKFIEGFTADKVLFEQQDGKKTAVGVTGRWRSRDAYLGSSDEASQVTRPVTIYAKRVIVSGGSLQSPTLLLRSGLTNPHIGRHLKLHPAIVVGARFPPQPSNSDASSPAESVNPWEGGILTTVVDSLQDLDGQHHGAKVEATAMVPSLFLPLMPWGSAVDFKLRAAQFRHMTGFISLCRDRDGGKVYQHEADKDQIRISYTPSKQVRQHSLEGVVAIAKMAYVCGAEEILTTTRGVSTFVADPSEQSEDGPSVNDLSFRAWVAEVRKDGLLGSGAAFASAHQMGSCRMSSSPKTGVVGPNGNVWGTENLFVADASVFPSASGVNPMVTNMAISDYISRGVAKGLGGKVTQGEELRARL